MNLSQMIIPNLAVAPNNGRYELRFQPLRNAGRAFAFPCDAAGHVDMDSLSDSLRDNYLYARTVVGREFLMPAVVASAAHRC